MHWKLLGYALDVTSSCKGCCACKGRERFLFPLFFIPPLLPRPSNRRSSKHDAIHDHRTRYGETWMLEKYDWNFGNNSVSRDKVFISKSSLCFIESATKNSIRWSNDLVPSPLFFFPSFLWNSISEANKFFSDLFIDTHPPLSSSPYLINIQLTCRVIQGFLFSTNPRELLLFRLSFTNRV